MILWTIFLVYEGEKMTAQQIVDAVASYIRTRGGQFSVWYCGIASDPNDCLLNRHNAGARECHAGYWDCGNDTVARQVEKAFVDAGCKGGGGGGDRTTKYLYVYVITAQTRE